MKRLIIILLLVYTKPLSACKCSNYDPLSDSTLKKYKYVAFVRIKTFAPFTISTLTKETSDYVRTARFTVEVIENFKAPLPDALLLNSYETSCDIGLRSGEEWIIFANDFHDYATVSPCNYSARYRDKNGKRDLAYNSGENLLHQLRQLVGIREVSKNGHFEAAYATGKKEYAETYKLGKLDGNRQYWYPNGQLWGRETYVNGVKEGIAEQWFEDGHIERREKYLAGVPVDTSQSWYEVDTYLPGLKLLSNMEHVPLDSIQRLYSVHQLLSVTVHDQQGNSVHSENYYRTGRGMIETVTLPDKGVNYTTRFREDGSIQFTSLSEIGQNQRFGKILQTLVEIDFEEDGTRKGFYNDRQGRLIRRTLVKDGIETVLEEKRYPDKDK